MLSTEWWVDREGGVDEWVAEEQPKRGRKGEKVTRKSRGRESKGDSAIC